MTTPSNANTSGLEVVVWRYTLINERGDVLFSGAMLDGPPREGPCGVDTWRAEPLVTAASAQDAIDAEKARADRLAKALERAADDLRDIGTQKPQPTNSPDPEHENYLRRVLISLGQVGNARARAALQQETQP